VQKNKQALTSDNGTTKRQYQQDFHCVLSNEENERENIK